MSNPIQQWGRESAVICWPLDNGVVLCSVRDVSEFTTTEIDHASQGCAVLRAGSVHGESGSSDVPSVGRAAHPVFE